MDSRAGLIESALTLFAARGYEAVGVQEIVATAGVTKPTLYHFFGSKLGLLEALVGQYAAPLDDAVGAACAAYAGHRRDLVATLDQVARAYLDFAAAHPLYFRFELACGFAAREGDPHRLVQAHRARRLVAIEGLFRSATREHGNMRGRERRCSVCLVGHLDSHIALQLDGELIVTDRVRRDLLHQFCHGIFS